MNNWASNIYNICYIALLEYKSNELKRCLCLKWYYVQYPLQKLGCNFYIFQKIAIYNDE